MQQLHQYLRSSLKSTNYTILDSLLINSDTELENKIPCFMDEECNIISLTPILSNNTIHSGYFCYFDPGKACFSSKEFAMSFEPPAGYDSFVVSEFNIQIEDELITKVTNLCSINNSSNNIQPIDINSISNENIFFILKNKNRIKKNCFVKFEFDPKLKDFLDKPCENCCSEQSVCYCFAERAVLCKKCDELMHNTKLTTRHRREYKDKEIIDYVTCLKDEMPCEFFCFSCKIPFCIYCKNIHSNHSIKEYKESVELIKEELINSINKNEEYFSNIKNSLLNTIKKYNCTISNLKYEISKEYLGLINKINLLNSINEKNIIGEYLLNAELTELFGNVKSINNDWFKMYDYYKQIVINRREPPELIDINKQGCIRINEEEERKVVREVRDI